MLSKIFYRFIPVALLLLGAWSVYIVVREPAVETMETNARRIKPDEVKKVEALPNITVNRPEISHLVDGKVTWKVFADKIDSNTGTGDALLNKSRGVFYREPDNENSRFEFAAPTTVYNAKTKAIRAIEGVTGNLLPEKIKLKAENIAWDEASGVLVANKIRMDTGTAIIKGERMDIRSDDRHIRLSGGVDAEFKPGGGK